MLCCSISQYYEGGLCESRAPFAQMFELTVALMTWFSSVVFTSFNSIEEGEG